eukprot:482736_1
MSPMLLFRSHPPYPLLPPPTSPEEVSLQLLNDIHHHNHIHHRVFVDLVGILWRLLLYVIIHIPPSSPTFNPKLYPPARRYKTTIFSFYRYYYSIHFIFILL